MGQYSTLFHSQIENIPIQRRYVLPGILPQPEIGHEFRDELLDHLRGWVRKVDSPAGARRALNGLYVRDPSMALEAAAESLRVAPSTPVETAHSLEIAVSIFEIDAVKSWALIEPRLHDYAWARTFWSRYAGMTRMSVPGIAEAETSVRFAAVSQLFELFPSRADPQHDGIFVSDNRDDLAHMRNGIVRAFVTAGTDEDLAALDELRRAFPQERWIGFWRHDALAANHAARNAWIPPSDLLKLVTSARGRLVRSDDELMELCLEVLAEYEGELHGMRPRCRELWNETPGDFRPKDEGAFTDHIAIYLEQQLKQNGAIINREVEIRPRIGAGGVKGERTDILIQARDPVLRRRFDVVIEGKGCWNKGLMTDMDGQLAGRYLKENQCTRGIYLVGWFVCPQWSSSDYRLGDTGKGTLPDLREALWADAEAVGRKHRAIIRSAVIDARLR